MRAVLEHIFAGILVRCSGAADLAQIEVTGGSGNCAGADREMPDDTSRLSAALQEAEAITTLPDALALDFQLAIKMTARPDFAEGVRAVLIDKTNDADWQPARLADVSRAMVDDVFATTGLPVLR